MTVVSATTIHPSPKPEKNRKPEGAGAWIWAAAILVVGAAALLTLGVAMRRGLNHDEHQFVAAGALTAKGLLPYRDFPYFHFPHLAYLYAAIASATDRLLLGARLVSVVAAVGVLTLLMGTALVRLRQMSPPVRLLAGTLSVVLVVSAPAYLHAAGRAWNHDVPLLLAMAAYLILVHALEQGGRLVWTIVAGALLGLAVGSRLSYAPLMLAYIVAPLLWSTAGRRNWRAVAGVTVGVVVGLLPTLYAFLADPNAFLFGNFAYASLNAEYYANLAQMGEVSSTSLTVPGKVMDAGRFLLQPGNLLIVLLTVFELVRVRTAIRVSPEIQFWLLLWPFLIVGALAPTPVQMQYVYVFIPFMLLGFLLLLAHDERPRLSMWLMGAAAMVSTLLALTTWGAGLAIVPNPSEWAANKIHARGVEIAALSGPGQVFTLSPIDPLEGGSEIDPRFATGPFAWRVAPLVDEETGTRFGMVTSDELASEWNESPPRSIFGGLHDDDAGAEAWHVAWAQDHGYVPVQMPDEGTLWLSPMVEWGGLVRMGGHTFPQRAVDAGETFVATLYLQAAAPIESNLNLLLRAMAQDGSELFRTDGWPFGSPTSTWQPGEVWPDGHEISIPPDAAPGFYRVEASLYDPETLQTVGDIATVSYLEVSDQPESTQRPVATFGDGIGLAEVQVPEPVQIGGTLPISLTWRALETPGLDYTVFVHVIDKLGAVVAQADARPLGGFYPTSEWRPGQVIVDALEAQIPADIPAGEYHLHVGLYDSQTMQRLPASAGGDSVEVGAVRLE